MKTSINYLPEQKRDDLRRIVECVLEVLPDCEMIILYGSYARNTYVDYDQRIEYGIRTCFITSELHTKDYCRMLIYIRTKTESDQAFKGADEIRDILERYYPERLLSQSGELHLYRSIP